MNFAQPKLTIVDGTYRSIYSGWMLDEAPRPFREGDARNPRLGGVLVHRLALPRSNFSGQVKFAAAAPAIRTFDGALRALAQRFPRFNGRAVSGSSVGDARSLSPCALSLASPYQHPGAASPACWTRTRARARALDKRR